MTSSQATTPQATPPLAQPLAQPLAPPDPPPLAAVPPGQAEAEAICAGMDASAPEAVRVRVEDTLLECAGGRLDRCVGETRYVVANCGDEPVELRKLEITDGPRSGRALIFEPAEPRIAPRSVWSRTWRVTQESSSVVHADVVDMHGAPIAVTARPVRVSNPTREAAMAACAACDGVWGIQGLVYHDGCSCRARDAGVECRSGDECEGACKFDRWAISTPARPLRCTGAGKRRVCSARTAAVGRPIGRCSERVALRSCHSLLQDGIASEPDRPLPWGVTRICID